MNVVGLTQEEQDEIFKMLAVILWLGNVQFAEGDDGNSVIGDTDGRGFFKRTSTLLFYHIINFLPP